MECHVFYKVSDRHYVLLDESWTKSLCTDFAYREPLIYERHVRIPESPKLMPKAEASCVFRDFPLTRASYLVVSGTNYVALMENGKRASGWRIFPYGTVDNKIIACVKEQAEIRADRFRLATRRRLLHDLLGGRTGLQECIQAFAHYAFFDKYALWIYNRHTDVFTCEVSFPQMPHRFVKDSSASSLHPFLAGGHLFEMRPPNPDADCINAEFAEEMKTLNRLRLNFSDSQEIGVLDLLSKYPGFQLRQETQNWIAHCIEMKYSEERQRSQIGLHLVERLFSQYTPGDIHGLLFELTKKICEEFCFQACSILLADEKQQNLTLAATCDQSHSGRPSEAGAYSIARKTMTTSVYTREDKTWDCSYDLSTDERNTHTYDESTESVARTWIAFRLEEKGRRFGILRVKNKHVRGNVHVLTNFSPADIDGLSAVSTHLSSILSTDKKYVEYTNENRRLVAKKDELNLEIKSGQDQFDILLHEMRTPISTLSTSPLIITRLFNAHTLTDDIRQSIHRKLEDIRLLGERLTLLTSTYDFKELLRNQRSEALFVLSEVVYPVVNISREYLRKQHGLDLSVDAADLEYQKVLGDKRLLQVVLNALISNAGKYSIGSKKPIRIAGARDASGRFLCIQVENYGLAIRQSEVELIFQKGFQGQAAKERRVGGVGIGLYVAKEIMKRHEEGDLLLTRREDPVTFVIKLKRV